MQQFVQQNQQQTNLQLLLIHPRIKYFDRVLENIYQIKSSKFFSYLFNHFLLLSSSSAKQAAPTTDEDSEYIQKKKRKLAASSSSGTLNFSQW